MSDVEDAFQAAAALAWQADVIVAWRFGLPPLAGVELGLQDHLAGVDLDPLDPADHWHRQTRLRHEEGGAGRGRAGQHRQQAS